MFKPQETKLHRQHARITFRRAQVRISAQRWAALNHVPCLLQHALKYAPPHPSFSIHHSQAVIWRHIHYN